MASVITLTLNPCIDKSIEVERLIPEKKMHSTAPKLEPGGGGINVARGIKRLGGNASAIYLSGGYYGDALNRLLLEEGINALPVRTSHNTRENWMVYERATSRQYRFVSPGSSVSSSEAGKFLEVLHSMPTAQYIVMSGSMPPGLPIQVIGEIAKTARQNNAKFIVDASGESLVEAVRSGVYLIKPNMNELENLVSSLGLNKESIDASIDDIIAKGYCEVVVVSLGEAGAVFATKDIRAAVGAPKVRTLSTVGAGDSMVAGILFSLMNNKSIKESVQFGVACGTAATLNPGTALFQPDDARRLFESMQAEDLHKQGAREN